MKKTITSTQVVDGILDASTPQYKSAATQRLDRYVKQQTKLGRSERGVRANIKGQVTKLLS